MWASYVVVAAALFVVGGIGSKATDIGPWYRNLRKPSWNPPDWVFPVVWTTIYLFIIYSVGSAWNVADAEQRTLILIVVGINFVLNLLWNFLFFSLKNPLLALFDSILLWLSIVVMIIVLADIRAMSALILMPYLLWVSVATLLNLSIIRLNRGLSDAAG